MNTPSLFDEPPTRSQWREVPLPRFLSWSPAQQLAYCAARDEDSALYTLRADEAEWFRERAAIYKEMTRVL